MLIASHLDEMGEKNYLCPQSLSVDKKNCTQQNAKNTKAIFCIGPFVSSTVRFKTLLDVMK